MKLFILGLSLVAGNVAFAGGSSGGGGPPPVAAEGVDLETGVLTIEQEISEIVEVPSDLYSKYVLDSALGRPVMIDGKKHTTALMDLTNSQIVVRSTDKTNRRILLKRALDKMTTDKFSSND